MSLSITAKSVLRTEMTIDLSQFVDKEVHITLRNGEEFVTTLKKQYDTTYPYYFSHSSGCSLSYTECGIHDFNTSLQRSLFDIIKIKLRNPEPMTESLKCETLKGITKSLIPGLIPFVESHPKYAEVMYQLFDEFLTDKFGDMKPEVKGEIACMFMDSLTFRSVGK